MKKILILFFVLIAGAGYAQVEQDSTGVWTFYGYVGYERSPAIENDNKVLNDFIMQHEGDIIKLSIYMDPVQNMGFIGGSREFSEFNVYDDIDKKESGVTFIVRKPWSKNIVYVEEVHSFEGYFKVERVSAKVNNFYTVEIIPSSKRERRLK